MSEYEFLLLLNVREWDILDRGRVICKDKDMGKYKVYLESGIDNVGFSR